MGDAGLDLLLLDGSRARGTARVGSDWDLGFLGDHRLNAATLLAALVETLHDDRIDLADLAQPAACCAIAPSVTVSCCSSPARASAMSSAWTVGFWCDAQPVLQPGC